MVCGMRTHVAVLLAAGLLLVGCAPTAESSLTADQCRTFVDSYDDFNDVATRAGRTDDEMLEARAQMLDTWNDLADEAGEGPGAVIRLAAVAFEAGVNGGGFESDEYQEFLVARDAVIEVCEGEGKL